MLAVVLWAGCGDATGPAPAEVVIVDEASEMMNEPVGEADNKDEGTSEQPPRPGDPIEGPADVANIATIGRTLRSPAEAIDAGHGGAQLGAEAVFLASVLTGGQVLVTTGTLTQQQGTNQFVYSPTPTDKLVVTWSEGAPTVFEVAAFDGDLSRDADWFWRNDHDLRLRVQREGVVDFELVSSRLGGVSRGSMTGELALDDVMHSVNLTTTGTYAASVDGSAAEHESSERFQGMIVTPGVTLTVDETHDFKLLVFEQGITNVTRTANNTAVIGGVQYNFADIFVRYETLDGWPNVTDYWSARGVVSRDGESIGQISFDASNELWIELVLAMNGDRYELERFELPR